MNTQTDIITHKAAFLLSLQARQQDEGVFTSKGQKISDAIVQQFYTFDFETRGKIIRKMSQLKAENPSFDWERDWTKIN